MMPLLAHFASHADAPTMELGAFLGQPINRIEDHDLVLFYSECQSLPQETPELSEAALRFFQIQQQAFSRTTIVPFRFPSALADAQALRTYVASNSAALKEALARLAGMSQFEIRISLKERSTSTSGTEYLRTRAAAARKMRDLELICCKQFTDIATDWYSTEKPESKVIYALVRRDLESEFGTRFSSLNPPSGAGIVVLGPWPPGAFVTTRETSEVTPDGR